MAVVVVVMFLSGEAVLGAAIFVAAVVLVATAFRFQKWLRNFAKPSS